MKSVTITINGKEIIRESCSGASETIKTMLGLRIHPSSVGKICNGHMYQKAEYELKWTDATSQTTQHGHCREVIGTNGDDHFSMQKAAKSYDTSVPTIRKACEEGRLIKYKGELISLCYRKDAHQHIEDFMARLHKANAELEELRKKNAELELLLSKANEPEKVKITVTRIRKGVR